MPARLLQYGINLRQGPRRVNGTFVLCRSHIPNETRGRSPEPSPGLPRVAIPDASPETRAPRPARERSGARCVSRLGVCEHTSVRAAAARTYAGGAKIGAEILRRALE